MAESIPHWLARSVTKAVIECSLSRADELDLEDMPYQTGNKVQIQRFIGYEPRPKVPNAKDAADADNDSAAANGVIRKDALWAIVGDRSHEVLTRFSPECVTRFDNAHSRDLITLSRTTIMLQTFRLGVSATGPRMLSGQSGPFARGGPARLYLDVPSLTVWGNIGDVIYWDTTDLQDALVSAAPLLDDEGITDHSKAFRRWLVAARQSIAPSRPRKRTRPQQDSEGRGSALRDKDTAVAPPPFQMPTSKRGRSDPADIGEPSTSTYQISDVFSSVSTAGPLPDDSYEAEDPGWENFTLSGAAADLFGQSGAANVPMPTFDGGDLQKNDVLANGSHDSENAQGENHDEKVDVHDVQEAANSNSREPVLQAKQGEASASWAPPRVDEDTSLPVMLEASDWLLPETGPQEEKSGLDTVSQSEETSAAPAAERSRIKVSRRITEEERKRAQQQYDELMAQLDQ